MTADPALEKAGEAPFRSASADQGRWSRSYARFLDLLAAVSASMIVFSMVTVTGDVLLRYLFGSGIIWSFEVTEFLLLYIPMLAMPWLARRKGHIQIDLLLTTLPARWSSLLKVLSYGCVAALCIFMAYWSGVATLSAFERGALSAGIVPMPRWALLTVLPPSFFLTAIEFLRLAVIGIKEGNQQ